VRVGSGERARQRRGRFLVDVPASVSREQKAGLWRLVVYRDERGRWWARVSRFRSRTAWRAPLDELVVAAARIGQREAMRAAVDRAGVAS
jgi:hypothetical protein